MFILLFLPVAFFIWCQQPRQACLAPRESPADPVPSPESAASERLHSVERGPTARRRLSVFCFTDSSSDFHPGELCHSPPETRSPLCCKEAPRPGKGLRGGTATPQGHSGNTAWPLKISFPHVDCKLCYLASGKGGPSAHKTGREVPHEKPTCPNLWAPSGASFFGLGQVAGAGWVVSGWW